MERALLLWHFIHKGDPGERLDDLKLVDLGFSQTQGFGQSVTYGLDTQRSIKAGVIFPQAETMLTFWRSGEGKIVFDGCLIAKHRTVGGMMFEEMYFDTAGTLFGFTLVREYSDGRLTVGGNTSGPNDTDYYYAQFDNAGGQHRTFKLPLFAPAATQPGATYPLPFTLGFTR
jgi:hypothetical protein